MVTNGTTVKDSIVLQNISPDRLHEEASDIYSDQIAPLYEAKHAEEEDDTKNGKFYDVKHCVLNPDVPNEQKLLNCHFKRKYVPTTGGNKAGSHANGTLRAKERRRLAETVRAGKAAKEVGGKDKGSRYPQPPYNLGRLYDPRHISDYGGVHFDGHTNRAVQLDIRDIDGSLIPPWLLYEKLRPGTLIIATVTPTVFIMGDTSEDVVDTEYRDSNNNKRKRGPQKIYQLIIDSLRVIAESPCRPEPHEKHPGFGESQSQDDPDPKDDHIGTFKPFKRQRTVGPGSSIEGMSVSSAGGPAHYAAPGSSSTSAVMATGTREADDAGYESSGRDPVFSDNDGMEE